MPGKPPSLSVTIRNGIETLAICVPTLVDSARGKLTPATVDRRLFRWATRVIGQARANVTVHGESLPADWGKTPYVVMSNHQSYYDIPVLFSVLGGKLRMVGKQELGRVPIFGRAMTEAGFILVDRSNTERAVASLKRANAILARGCSVYIAPEGTRRSDGKLGPLKKGGFALALATSAPILPVGLWGTANIQAPKTFRSRPGEAVHVVIGKPITAHLAPGEGQGEGRDALMQRTSSMLSDLLAEAIGESGTQGSAR
jgi:1-acyl-sn-glycerol-3-phosphate acyltransferase